MSDRNLGQIVDSIVAVAPDLEPHFSSLRESIKYTAPEAMTMRWRQAYAILIEHASGHEHQEVLGRIFSGKANYCKVIKISKEEARELLAADRRAYTKRRLQNINNKAVRYG